MIAHDPADATATPSPLALLKTRMWVNAQRDGRPAKYRWCPLLNAAKFV